MELPPDSSGAGIDAIILLPSQVDTLVDQSSTIMLMHPPSPTRQLTSVVYISVLKHCDHLRSSCDGDFLSK